MSTSTAVARRKATKPPARFKPEEARRTQAIRDARIELAARLGNTEALEQEIDKKLDDQEDAVTWWRATVRPKGGRHTVKNADSTLLTLDQAEHVLGFDQQTISKWAKKLEIRDEYRDAIRRAARKKLQLEVEHNHRAQGTGENEWWTPAEHLDAARAVLGAIQLDPASTSKANETIKADRFFTTKDDGLKQKWSGAVWLNPPYSQPFIQQFIEKLCAELAAGNVSTAILLTHNYTDTQWFHIAAGACNAMCFTRGRIAFINPQGEKAAPTQGQCFFYFGEQLELFRSEFSRFGFIACPL